MQKPILNCGFDQSFHFLHRSFISSCESSFLRFERASLLHFRLSCSYEGSRTRTRAFQRSMVSQELQEEKNQISSHQLIRKLGKYELGSTLGEGNFGKVKLATNIETGQPFAVKIIQKKRIIDLNITNQIKREIATLKVLKHPNVVKLHERKRTWRERLIGVGEPTSKGVPILKVLASKTKIYIVLEYVTGGELFNRIASKGKLKEDEGRKLFQQLIDGVSYCHTKGVFHRDLKLENLLVDADGNLKISDFGLSALPQHFKEDGLLHTTCGSPNYVAPEILANRGYDGAISDVWSCGVILYVILTGSLPFDDRNLVVLYHKIFKGEVNLPKWLSPEAQNLIRSILDPNPISRITIPGIKADKWFKKDYNPTYPEEEEEEYNNTHSKATSINEGASEGEKIQKSSTLINAFQLIGMSSYLDLSGFFEKEDICERKIRFTSNHSLTDLLERMEDIVTEMGFGVQKKNGKLRVVEEHKGLTSPSSLSVVAEVLEISHSLYVVELRKTCGDSSAYRQLCKKLSSDLGVTSDQELAPAVVDILRQ